MEKRFDVRRSGRPTPPKTTRNHLQNCPKFRDPFFVNVINESSLSKTEYMTIAQFEKTWFKIFEFYLKVL